MTTTEIQVLRTGEWTTPALLRRLKMSDPLTVAEFSEIMGLEDPEPVSEEVLLRVLLRLPYITMFDFPIPNRDMEALYMRVFECGHRITIPKMSPFMDRQLLQAYLEWQVHTLAVYASKLATDREFNIFLGQIRHVLWSLNEGKDRKYCHSNYLKGPKYSMDRYITGFDLPEVSEIFVRGLIFSRGSSLEERDFADDNQFPRLFLPSLVIGGWKVAQMKRDLGCSILRTLLNRTKGLVDRVDEVERQAESEGLGDLSWDVKSSIFGIEFEESDILKPSRRARTS